MFVVQNQNACVDILHEKTTFWICVVSQIFCMSYDWNCIIWFGMCTISFGVDITINSLNCMKYIITFHSSETKKSFWCVAIQIHVTSGDFVAAIWQINSQITSILGVTKRVNKIDDIWVCSEVSTKSHCMKWWWHSWAGVMDIPMAVLTWGPNHSYSVWGGIHSQPHWLSPSRVEALKYSRGSDEVTTRSSEQLTSVKLRLGPGEAWWWWTLLLPSSGAAVSGSSLDFFKTARGRESNTESRWETDILEE